MLNTQKLLFILPDLAYVTELLPDKKPHTFSIQSCKQINGEFLNETEFIPQNVVKLIDKLEPGEEYFLILPDYLFTNTIISVDETSDTKIKEKLTTEVLPKLNLTEDTHLIETVSLSELKGTSRVQLSAIEKSILTIIKVTAADKGIKIAGIAPLSWTVKSLISLEPSISVLQMGEKLYTAQHYIGVDQTTTAEVSNPENVVETIKTLKGAEPSIQTVYLASNAVVEEKIKDELHKTLPIQQMATKANSEKIPSYVSQIIIAAMRTLTIPDYTVPTFKLAKPTQDEKDQFATVLSSKDAKETENEAKETKDLPKPSVVPAATTDTADQAATMAIDLENVKEEPEKPADLPEIEDTEKDTMPAKKTDKTPAEVVPALDATGAAVAIGLADAANQVTFGETSLAATTDSQTNELDSDSSDKPEEKDQMKKEMDQEKTTKVTTDKNDVSLATDTADAPETATSKSTINPTTEMAPVVVGTASADSLMSTGLLEPTTNETSGESTQEDIDLKQFTQTSESGVESAQTAKPVIKNKSGANQMLKMILITTGVFIVTVAIGVGVGMAILKYSGQQNAPQTPPVEVEEVTPSPEPTPTPTPEASSSATLDKSKLKLLIVNATAKAGYAGQIKTKLATDKFTNVTTGNAKGDYSAGNFIYLKETNPALVSAIEKATALDITATASAQAEDTQGSYDAVLVLAK